MMTFEMFQPQIDCISPGCRVIGYNNRTWFRPEEPHTLDHLVEDCRDLLDELRIRRCTLFGMSMGGHMAIPFALKYPDRLDGLVLMGAGAAAFPLEIQEITGESFAQLDIEGPVPREWAERTARVVFGETTFADNRVLIDHWIEQWTRAPARVVYRQGMSWIYKKDLSRRIGEIGLPVQIIHGEEETAYLMEWVLPMLELLPDVKLARIPRAGHFANLENPAAVNAALSSFLKQLYPNHRATPSGTADGGWHRAK